MSQDNVPNEFRLVSRSPDEFRQNIRTGGCSHHQVYGMTPEEARTILVELRPYSCTMHVWVARSEFEMSQSVYLEEPVRPRP